MKSRRRTPEAPKGPSWQRPSGLVEFEYVSLASARAIANELPGGVVDMLDRVPGYWHRVRRPAGKPDLVLLPLTMEWMRTLPKEIWPLQTGATYPRILNRIAHAWANRDEREFVFEDLLNSRRKNRRGFPAPVKEELQALQIFALGMSPDAPTTHGDDD
jgi:hypothetical protein